MDKPTIPKSFLWNGVCKKSKNFVNIEDYYIPLPTNSPTTGDVLTVDANGDYVWAAGGGACADATLYRTDGVTVYQTIASGGSYTTLGVDVTDAGTVYTREDGETYDVFRISEAIIFDGVNQYATAPNAMVSGVIEYNQDFSFEFWFRSGYSGSNVAPFIDWLVTNAGFRLQFLGNTSGNALEINFRTDVNERIEATLSGTYNDNTWRHFVITYTAGDLTNTSNIKVYIDGVNTSFTVNRNDITDSSIDHAGDMYIATNAALTRPCDIYMSNLKLFNVALTPSQVLARYNNGVPVDCSGFANIVEQFTLDGTPNGLTGTYNLTLFNSPVYTKNRP